MTDDWLMLGSFLNYNRKLLVFCREYWPKPIENSFLRWRVETINHIHSIMI